VVQNLRFPVLVHDLRCVLWIIHPVAEPLYESRGANLHPLFLSEVGRLAVGCFHPLVGIVISVINLGVLGTRQVLLEADVVYLLPCNRIPAFNDRLSVRLECCSRVVSLLL